MSIFVFIVVIIIAYIVVKIGSAAFELTGMDPEQAHFQSVSAFTGTGFTTRESELITLHRERRKIATALMILGNAGFVTLIATLVSTINPGSKPVTLIPGLDKIAPLFLVPYLNLSLILLVPLLIHRVFRSSRFSAMLMNKVQEQMVDKKFIQRASFEELLLSAKGYGISQIEITEDNPLAGKTLYESKLREHDILVLSVERGDDNIVNPAATTSLQPDDILICFGRLDSIRKVAYENTSLKARTK
jgi:K+/H+ antiporter YhaU regulatory subunit KhtT